jgi:hypothetical protein
LDKEEEVHRHTYFLALVLGLALTSLFSAESSGDPRSTNQETIYLINDGDSLMSVMGSSSGKTSLSFVVPKLPSGALTANTSIPGETLAQMVANFWQHVGRKHSYDYRLFIVHSLGGSNDLRRGTPAASIYALLQAYVKSVHALGSNAVSIVATYPLQCDIFNNPARRDAIKSFNELIYERWNKPQSSDGLEADALVDYFGDPTIGANSYSSSAFCSPQWSQDGGHLNDDGKAVMGRIEVEAIAKYLGTKAP